MRGIGVAVMAAMTVSGANAQVVVERKQIGAWEVERRSDIITDAETLFFWRSSDLETDGSPPRLVLACSARGARVYIGGVPLAGETYQTTYRFDKDPPDTMLMYRQPYGLEVGTADLNAWIDRLQKARQIAFRARASDVTPPQLVEALFKVDGLSNAISQGETKVVCGDFLAAR